MNRLPDDLTKPLAELLLSIADDKLVLGHRNADWTGLAPILEEDIAFSALAQDDLAHASALYELVGELTGDDADRLAYGRELAAYRCCAIVELADEFDWSVALVRQFFCDHFDTLRLQRLAHSSYEPLAALGRKMSREESLAIGHADEWIVRLAKASDDARERMLAAFGTITPLTPTMFEPTEGVERIESAGVYPPLGSSMFDVWKEMVANVLESAGLHIALPGTDPESVGGRRGQHTAAFAPLLDEMAEVYRVEPEAQW